MQFSTTLLLATLAALASATPVALAPRNGGGDGGDKPQPPPSSGPYCGNNEVVSCCKNDPSAPTKGGISLGNTLAGTLQCSPIDASILALLGPLLPITSSSVCSTYAACCTGDNSQTGLININAPCTSINS